MKLMNTGGWLCEEGEGLIILEVGEGEGFG